MAKAKAGRLTPTQIKAWCVAKKKEFESRVELLLDTGKLDCDAYNGEQVDNWLRVNLHPNTYADEKVRNLLATMMLERPLADLVTVFGIKYHMVAWDWGDRNNAARSFHEDLTLSLTMNPSMDGYEERTENLHDMHILKLKSKWGL